MRIITLTHTSVHAKIHDTTTNIDTIQYWTMRLEAYQTKKDQIGMNIALNMLVATAGKMFAENGFNIDAGNIDVKHIY